jgi:hypothetical protein
MDQNWKFFMHILHVSNIENQPIQIAKGKKVDSVTNLHNKLKLFWIHIFSWTQNKKYVLSVYIG